MLVDKKEAKINSVYSYYIRGLLTISETMHWLTELDMNLYITDDDVELNLSLSLYGGGHKYMKIWFSDNPPADDENVGCIGISIYNEDLKDLKINTDKITDYEQTYPETCYPEYPCKYHCSSCGNGRYRNIRKTGQCSCHRCHCHRLHAL